MPSPANQSTVAQQFSPRVAHRKSPAVESSMVNPAFSSAGRSSERRVAYKARCAEACDSSPSAATIAACTGAGTIIPACFRPSSSADTNDGSPATNPARYPARLDRLDSECTVSTPSYDVPHTDSSDEGTASQPSVR